MKKRPAILTRLLMPRAWIAKVLLTLSAVAFFSLGYLDYLQPIVDFLSSEALTLKVGETKLSTYTLIKAVLTIMVLFWITGIFTEFGETRISRLKNIRASNRALIIKALQIGIYFVAFIVGLDILDIDLTTLTVLSGAIGIGIGFGLQKVTSNFISGLILLFEKSIENGDLVELSDNTYGFVKQTGARYTLIENFDGKETMVPNEDFITNRVTNWTFSNPQGRIEIVVGVSYSSDIEKAMDLILEAAKEHNRCVTEPEPVCYLTDFGDSSVNFLLYFWVADVTEGRLLPKSDVLRSIWHKFKEHDIEIPFPQRDLHIKNTEMDS